ncbi:copper chaperone PCu(A)C [Neisseria zoodegmatis]|uniref:Uncharacterized protein conserved in bacteria n=1 Tax=Neisseria zoodegmatis TaxID=326523 RepID=A0A1X3CQC0_9NEIS|nr:copper chaperone PCu(A)C [Neisseria zoodegmatis]OSI09714.1 hypothetical protein BWD10_07975 [Neisseria zoodegmatis]SNU79503.1 Uncharacterized protein conserved in bacteria [Neisseria zoodegmatis]SUA44609.1 Uncharacterized protein conserved in bacteria [Neisseria zoodegmatis]
MKKLLSALMLAGLCHTAFAADIDVDDVWARATVEGMTMGGAFMDIKNETKSDDVLVGATSPVSDRVEMHTHTNDKGVMRMREVKGGIPLPKGKETKLQPGGYHVMFMGLKAPLKEGDKFPLTLKFKKAKPKTVEVEVKTAPKNGGHDHHHHGHDHKHSH